MRSHRSLALLLPFLLLPLAASAPLRADDDVAVEEEHRAYPLDGARLLSVEAPVGKLTIHAVDIDHIEAHLDVLCDEDSRRCRERAKNIRLRSDRDGDDLELEVAGYPRGNSGRNPPRAYLELRVPRSLAVRLELGVGEIEVRGMHGDLDAELGVGEVNVFVPEAAVRNVGIDVGVGEAELSPRPSGTRSSRFLFLGNEVDWQEGSGAADVNVEVGVGEAHVKLMP
jgi:hypothetical protein